jgi:hypothetical protein
MLAARLSGLGIVRATVLMFLDGGPPACCCSPSPSRRCGNCRLDPSFSHNDWAFAHSTGRLSYEFPPVVQQIEQQLKAAKEAAIQQGSASEKRGKPFWTIRPPKTQPLLF